MVNAEDHRSEKPSSNFPYFVNVVPPFICFRGATKQCLLIHIPCTCLLLPPTSWVWSSGLSSGKKLLDLGRCTTASSFNVVSDGGLPMKQHIRRGEMTELGTLSYMWNIGILQVGHVRSEPEPVSDAFPCHPQQ